MGVTIIMTADEFVKQLKSLLNKKTIYLLGCYGQPITSTLIKQKSNQSAQLKAWYTPERIKEATALIGTSTLPFDCCGLYKGIMWGLPNPKYARNVPDHNASGAIKLCNDVSTDFSNIQEGEFVFTKDLSHMGYYVGGDKVIEVTYRWNNGVQCTQCWNIAKTETRGRLWHSHGKYQYIDYPSGFNLSHFKDVFNNKVMMKQGSKGDNVRLLQQALNTISDIIKVPLLDEDGSFGSKTLVAVNVFKKKYGIDETNVGIITLAELFKRCE